MVNLINKFFFIVVLGIFLIPSNLNAFRIKSNKPCCKAEAISKAKKQDCCNGNHSKNKDNSCGGKCGHSFCTGSKSINYSLLTYFDFEFKINNFDYSVLKPKFYHSITNTSSGFCSIWLIPKIG